MQNDTRHNLNRVLIVAPIGRDATLLLRLLNQFGIRAAVCANLAVLGEMLQAGAAAVIAAEEALMPQDLPQLTSVLGQQPPWSAVPIVVLLHPTRKGHTTEPDLAQLGHVLLLERPVRTSTLLTAVRTALRTRQHQYQIRDYLHEQQQLEEDRRQMERQLQETQKLESLGILAGGIAHDFNNLLVAVLGNASLARAEVATESSVDRLLEHIELAAERAADLVRQLLAYAGKGRFVVEQLNVNRIITEMMQLLQVSIPKHIHVQYALASQLPDIEADATQIQQVVMNLVINAAEAIGPDHGRITISTGTHIPDRSATPPADGLVYLAVADTGSGMDDSTRTRIFEPFFTTKFTGRGLGLSAVAGIIRAHGGAIEVESAPAQGTTITCVFPRATAQTRPVPASAPATAAWHGAGTVLLIDDEAEVRTIAQRMLEHCGLHVLSAPDGRTGLAQFQAHMSTIDCVLLDLTLPDISGLEIFSKLQQLGATIPVIFMSGYTDHEGVRRLTDRRLATFLAKPFTLAALREQIRQTMERRRQQRAHGSASISSGAP